ncbi:diguanylate cyclase (GGDEF) domain-containing protein [Ruminococcaceae bacterium YRB3002]|nr:diguanylate cyclase (GGDEF) domain-containing protein [Ruminococcaceae bacterium YRB3002]
MNNSVLINLSGINSKEMLHGIVKEAFGFPDYYGGNLDALHDMLTSLDTPKHLVVAGEDDPDPEMRTYIPKFVKVLADSAEENPNFTYEMVYMPKKLDRRPLVVCGSWEDAENLNMFLAKLNIPELTSRFVICSFSFGTSSNNITGLSKTKVEFELAYLITELNPAGLVIFAEMLKSPVLTEHLAQLGHDAGIPVFMLEHAGDGCINFELDYREGFRSLVKHVIEVHKCKDILMMAGFKGNIFSEERIKIFKEELKAHDLKVDSNKIIYGDFWYIPAEQVLKDYLNEHDGQIPEAIVCANDTMAMGCCDYLISLGYRIPDDCIITGFDGIKDALCHFPTITTAEPDYSEISRIIAETMTDWDPTEAHEVKSYKIRYKPLIKHSCGCCKSSMEELEKITSILFKDNQDYFLHVHEMGRLTSTAITLGDTNLLAAFLDNHLWLWKDQMFFVGLTESPKCINAIYSSWKDKYEYGNKIYNASYVLPNFDEIMAKDSGMNFLLFAQLRSADEAYGYICTGAETITLRLQQRFEEMESYVSSIVHSVLNNRKLMAMNKEMKSLSELDYMTGLYNRRGFLSRVSKIVREPANRSRVFNYIMMDMDNLKSINDNYGHQIGDTVIKALAYAIQTRVHKNGISSRFGGDEFAFVIISDEPLEDQADRIRAEIEDAALYDSSLTGKPYKIEASIGIASCPVSDFTMGRIDACLERIMNKADERMYSDKQKRHGR